MTAGTVPAREQLEAAARLWRRTAAAARTNAQRHGATGYGMACEAKAQAWDDAAAVLESLLGVEAPAPEPEPADPTPPPF